MTENETVQKGFSGLGEVFTVHFVDNDDQRYGYRPVVLLIFAIEYGLFGMDPKVSHTVNLIIYLLTLLVLFEIFRLLFNGKTPWLSVIALMVFMFHPMHTEVVDNIKSRDELLSFGFGMTALWCFLRHTDRRKWLSVLMGVLFLALALLSKTVALSLLIIIPLSIYFTGKISLKRGALIAGSIVALTFGIRMVKNVLLAGGEKERVFYFWENPLFFNDQFTDRIPAALYTLYFYLKQMILPYDLSFYYGYNAIPIADWGHPIVYLSLAAHLLLLGYAIWKLPKKDPLAYGILCYLIAIGMFSNLLIPMVGIVADRFAYFASFGFSVAVAVLIVRWLGWANALQGRSAVGALKFYLVLGLFVFYAGRTIARNADWKDKLTLYEHDVKVNPESAKIHALIALEYHKLLADKQVKNKKDMVNKAALHYERTLAIHPHHAIYWNNLGDVYQSGVGNMEKALVAYQHAVNEDPENGEFLYNYALALEKSARYAEAAEKYGELLQLDRQQPVVYRELANALYKSGDLQEAIEVTEDAVVQFPRIIDFHLNLAMLYGKTGEQELRLKYLLSSHKLDPRNNQVKVQLVRTYRALGNEEEAKKYENLLQR